MSITFRPYREGIADYEISAEIETVILPDYSHSSADWHLYDQQRPDHVLYKRWIVEQDNQPIGHVAYEQFIEGHHPQKFQLRCSLLPDHHGQGIGRQMAKFLENELAPYNPIWLKTGCVETQIRAVHFLEEHGFQELRRSWHSQVDPATINLADWQSYIDRVQGQGIIIKHMGEVETTVPNAMRQIYELTHELDHDIPGSSLTEPLPFDVWIDHIFKDPRMQKEAHFFAIDGDKLIGYSGLWKDLGSNNLHTGLTGVQRTYRKRGIAMALKLHAIRFAQQIGSPCIRTWNATYNRPMLNINERLGFQKAPAWITFEKNLDPQEIR